jgi:hypothetical protein
LHLSRCKLRRRGAWLLLNILVERPSLKLVRHLGMPGPREAVKLAAGP